MWVGIFRWWCEPKFIRNIQETFQAQIEEILRNIEPALENVFLKKKKKMCTRKRNKLALGGDFVSTDQETKT